MIGTSESVLSENHKIYWDYLGRSSEAIAKCQVICTDIQTGWLNGVIAHEITEGDSVFKVVEEIVQYFKERGNLPFSWWVEAKKEPSQLGEALQKHEIVSLGEFAGMVLSLDCLEHVAVPYSLGVERILNEKSMTEMISVLVDAYEADAKVADFAKELFWKASQRKEQVMHFLGKEEGMPVTAGSLFIYHHTACIYHVGTIHSARKKGYASYLMYTMLETAKKMGCVSSVLVSTPKGKNLYTRLGYRVDSIFHHYMKI